MVRHGSLASPFELLTPAQNIMHEGQTEKPNAPQHRATWIGETCFVPRLQTLSVMHWFTMETPIHIVSVVMVFWANVEDGKT